VTEPDFRTVTELAGIPVTTEQIVRLCNRYFWACTYCSDKDVLEVGCGTGPGLGCLAAVSKTLEAGDYSSPILEVARRHYGGRVALREFDAEALPFPDKCKDVVILFEAIYYLRDAEKFVRECRRVLRPAGKVLIASANKDLWDFHPSAHSHRYFGVVELGELFGNQGFTTEFFGFQNTAEMPLKQKALRPIKRFAVTAGLIPRTMSGKRWLKRLVFGAEVPMPAEISASMSRFERPEPIAAGKPNRAHKIIYCTATLV
jgi:ubiquinone/menaquinone biosynthesis C-methylase UbiE